MNDTNYTGNISTIVKYISMLLAGYLISALAARGLNLNIDQTLLSEVIGSVIFLVLAHIDATHPNTLKILGNQPKGKTPTSEETVEDDSNERR